MLVLFTDFGINGPYLGQMQAAIYAINPGARIVNLFANAPGFNPRAASYLLAAYARDFPEGTVFVCVIDPGVGTQARRPVVMNIDGRQFVGPDNGLFDILVIQSRHATQQEIAWRPHALSATFHGRDLFAPVAAHLENCSCPAEWLTPPVLCDKSDVAGDLYEIIYIDDFGNAMTGVRAARVAENACLKVGGLKLERQRTYADVAGGEAFWYENANGLVEVAVSHGNAAVQLSLAIGVPIKFQQ